jgi:hypothetical protein
MPLLTSLVISKDDYYCLIRKHVDKVVIYSVLIESYVGF